MQHAARAEEFLELGVFGVVRILRLFFGVQVVEVAKELVEAVDARQKFVPVAEMVLTKLRGGVTEWLKRLCNAQILVEPMSPRW